MKEVHFIRRNRDKWLEIETIANKNYKDVSPDTIAEAYEELSADLAFAETHYPESALCNYLNAMAISLHNRIYGYKQQRLSRFVTFWTVEVPQEVYRNRKMMIASVLLFLLSVLVGTLSTVMDVDYASLVLGDSYVDMTLDNIKEGKPMNVYADSENYIMFCGITLNNIYVSFLTYSSGLFTFFATMYFLIENGVMLGVFQTFCYQHGVIGICLTSMWLHGVIEITSIVIAGGAGLTLGAGWMFPGSYPRITSFVMSAKSSVKIIIGLMPMFIVAGFIESFLTRYTPNFGLGAVVFITIEVMAMAYYFVYLPIKVNRTYGSRKV